MTNNLEDDSLTTRGRRSTTDGCCPRLHLACASDAAAPPHTGTAASTPQVHPSTTLSNPLSTQPPSSYRELSERIACIHYVPKPSMFVMERRCSILADVDEWRGEASAHVDHEYVEPGDWSSYGRTRAEHAHRQTWDTSAHAMRRPARRPCV